MLISPYVPALLTLAPIFTGTCDRSERNSSETWQVCLVGSGQESLCKLLQHSERNRSIECAGFRPIKGSAWTVGVTIGSFITAPRTGCGFCYLDPPLGKGHLPLLGALWRHSAIAGLQLNRSPSRRFKKNSRIGAGDS